MNREISTSDKHDFSPSNNHSRSSEDFNTQYGNDERITIDSKMDDDPYHEGFRSNTNVGSNALGLHDENSNGYTSAEILEKKNKTKKKVDKNTDR
jgi:MFS family permease